MHSIINRFVYLLLFYAYCGVLCAQNTKVDSLQNILKTAKEDTSKVNVLNELSKRLWRTANDQQGMKYAEEALLLAEKLNFKPGINWAYENIGMHYQYQGIVAEALKNYSAALKVAENLGDKDKIANAYLWLGSDHKQQGRLQTNDSVGKEFFNVALKYELAALKISLETGNKWNTKISYNDLGVTYQYLGNNSEALKKFLAALEIAEELGDKRQIAITSLNIASIYQGFGKYDKAIKMASNAMKAATESGNRREIAISYSDLGRTYYFLKEYTKARVNLNQGLAIAKEIGNKEHLVGVYENLSELDSVEGNWKAAYIDYKLSTLYHDSLNIEENAEKFLQIRMQYESDKRADSLKQRQLLIDTRFQAQEKQKNFYLIGAILSALLSVFIFLNFHNQRKVNRMSNFAHVKEKAELELNSLRAQLNPHFMFNSLNAIQELILKEDFDNSHTYLARFAKLLRILLDNAEKPFVQLSKEVDFLELYLSLERLRIPDLKFSITIDPSINTGETLLPNMVLQPYIENALWHGLSQKKGDKILELAIHKQNGSVIYDVKDNGVGRKKAAEFKSLYRKEHKSKGMELLTKRFKLLNEEFGSEIKTQVRDVMNNDEVAGTLVSINVPNSISIKARSEVL